MNRTLPPILRAANGGIGAAGFDLIESTDSVEPADFLETFEAIEPDWCEGCTLPRESCCCPDGEWDDVDLIGGGLEYV